VGLFRRRKPLHERLLEEAGMGAAPAEQPFVAGPRETMVGVHGVARRREWDAVATVEAPDVQGDIVEFDVLPDQTVLVEDETGDAELAPLADAIEHELTPPYRARAVRQGSALWAVAARSIEVIRLPNRNGDSIEVSKRGDERVLTVDGAREFGSVPELDTLASQRYADYVVRAERLDGDWWEVRIDPL
jgi:hypothetical protein